MKKLIASFTLATVLTLAGCGGSNDSDVGQTFVTQLGHIADALESVKDEDSARAAAHQMDQANMALKNVTDRMNGMSDMEKAVMIQKHVAEIAQLEGRITMAIQNIVSNDPELMNIIGDEMRNMPQLE